MTIAIPHAIKLGGRIEQQPAVPAAMPELTPEQEAELYGEWTVAVQSLAASTEAAKDHVVGDYLVHGVHTTGLITATRMYNERDDRWLPTALQAAFPGYQVTTAKFKKQPEQPVYLSIATKPETAQPAHVSHENLRALGAELLQMLHL